MSKLEIINQEINQEIGNEAVRKALVATTFRGFDEVTMKQAILEGMIRGFKFSDFMEKNVYAIPFEDKRSGKQTYSLITSIDMARKVGMRSGVVGKSAPVYEEGEGKFPKTCSVTIKRKIKDYIGEYTATVYFDEYNTGKNLWIGKPRTMIAKVAEMHALRMACPEELSQVYGEEELDKERGNGVIENKVIVVPDDKLQEFRNKLEVAANAEELKAVWAGLPTEAKQALEGFKNELKAKFDPKPEAKVKVPAQGIVAPLVASVDHDKPPFPDISLDKTKQKKNEDTNVQG